MGIRAIYHLGEKKQNIDRLTNRFPEIEFIFTRSDAELADEIGKSAFLILNGADYSTASAKAAHASKTLKWIQFASAGIDGVVRNGGYPAHVLATNVSGLRAGNLSEHAFAMLLFLTRQLRAVEHGRVQRQWLKEELFPGMVSLQGRTMLILGLGAIGQAAARKAKGFDMRVTGISRAFKPGPLVDKVYPRQDCDEAFRQADILLVAAPSDDQTQGFVNAEKLALMKKSAILINVSRGDIVDENALIAACRERRIAGAGIDVTVTEPLPADSELWRLDNVIVTPHVGGGGSDQLARLLDRVAENVARFVAGEPLENLVTD